jgi:hypothetical protein
LFDDWRTPTKWISDPVGYVFLPRAMLEIGRALYPNEWTGAEPTTPVFLPLPLRSADARQWQKSEAHIALCRERPDFGRKPLDALPHYSNISLSGFSKGSPIIPPFTDAEWEAARAIYRSREDAARPAWVRYAQVRKIVTDACRQGQLAFGLRPRSGGAVYAGKPEWWETEGSTLHYRFECFRMSSTAPFASGLRDDVDWICISRDSLNAFLARFKSSHPSTAKAESDAVKHLASKLKENPNLTKTNAEAECRQFKITQRGFRERVWPNARTNAGLSATAPAGRKRQKKSPH